MTLVWTDEAFVRLAEVKDLLPATTHGPLRKIPNASLSALRAYSTIHASRGCCLSFTQTASVKLFEKVCYQYRYQFWLGKDYVVAQVIVRNLEDAVLRALRAKAQLHGRALEQELRENLIQASGLSPEEKFEIVSRIRAMPTASVARDSTEIIREDRANR